MLAGQTFTLGRLFDVRVGVHVSWLAVYAFVTYALAGGLAALPFAERYGFAAVCALALFASVVAHEFGHALAARCFGVRTDAITLFLFGGVATLEHEPPSPLADALVALAGPALSAVLAALAFAGVAIAARLDAGAAGSSAATLCAYLSVANGVLAAFNLVPAYPTDGGRVLRAILWQRGGNRLRATVRAARVGMAFAVVLAAAGMGAAIALRAPLYCWYAVLAAFLWRQGAVQVRAADALADERDEVPAAA